MPRFPDWHHRLAKHNDCYEVRLGMKMMQDPLTIEINSSIVLEWIELEVLSREVAKQNA